MSETMNKREGLLREAVRLAELAVETAEDLRTCLDDLSNTSEYLEGSWFSHVGPIVVEARQLAADLAAREVVLGGASLATCAA